ncbi:MAG TPA: TIGR03619 family F420-dependent LLM class oxidoreductase [Candidatus Binataceae bacterium]|nr:TIGR03619 family F420-dependent LLM class oxidoreductase [Candidatus Binataceae bacterium]
MKFGIQTKVTLSSIGVAELARAIEQRGLEALFLAEYTHIPKQHKSPFGGPLPEPFFNTFDPLIALAAAAQATGRITLGTCVMVVVQRNPIVLAKEVATLDQLSGGRFVLGVGAGGIPEANLNHGVTSGQRWQVLRETVLALKQIWNSAEPEFHGEIVNFDPIISNPKPKRPGGPPILLGGHAPRTIERAAQYCDGWFPGFGYGSFDLAAGIEAFRRAAASAGRSADALAVNVVSVPIDEAKLRPLLALGIERIVFQVPSEPRDTMLPILDRCAEVAGRLNG